MNDSRPAGSSVTYRCGAIEIDATHRQMLIDGAPARIGGRAFAVLLALVERRERVVSKQELMELVWPKLVVEENNLLVHMVALRKLLGPQAIATIPGRGYRFALAVDAVNGSGLTDAKPASEAIRGNLPVSPPLFGRATDLDAVDALMREHALVTIVGAGGIGKTRLALAAAASAKSGFPDGRWWVELAPITEGTQVPNSIAAALGLQLPTGRPAQEAIVTALTSQNLLMVLDSCEHLAEEIASLVEVLHARAPNVRLLVTSQESLKCRDEQVYRLGPLAVPTSTQLEEAAQAGAVALFVERAHAVGSQFRLADENVAMVIDVCRRLDGIPLAIELAAARLPLLGVHGLHARLNQMFNILTGGARMKLRRHQTLRAAFDWSHGLLSADEKTAFRRLGVFAGGFTLELAQQVVSDECIDQWLVLDLLGHLIDKSLVIVEGEPEPRYRLLETTRAFALEQLAVAGESEALLQRHAQAVCALMAVINEAQWTRSFADRSRTELSNLRAALDWTMTSADGRALAYELLGKCWLAWIANGLIYEGMQRMLQLCPLPSSLPTRIEADFWLALALLDVQTGGDEHWDAACRAGALFRQLGDADKLCQALLIGAAIGAARNQMSESEQALREAETLVADTAPLRQQALLAETQGMYFLRSGALELAVAAYRKQAELSHRAGAVRREYVAMGNIGSVLLAEGELDSAIDALRKSVDGLRSILPRQGLQLHLGTLAVALAWRGGDEDILPIAREGFEHARLARRTFAPLMAAALQHVRRDVRRAVVLAGYAYAMPPLRRHPCLNVLPMWQRVRDRASAAHPPAAVEAWRRAGECLTEEQAAAIAFDDAPLDALEAHLQPVVG